MRLKILVLSLAKYVGLFAIAKRYTAKQLRILCYHGGSLGDETSYNPKLFSSKEFFERRVAWLIDQGFDILPLDQAVRTPAEARGKLATVITFDDGWYSTGSELLPVLAERKLPSTLYLCTQHFLEAWPVVNVAVRYLLWKGAGKVHVQDFGPGVDGEYDLADAVARNKLALGFVGKLAQGSLDRASVCGALEQLARSIGVDPASLQLDSRRFDYMSADELRHAAANGCSIELHGHVHLYPQGQPEQFRADLQRCNEVIGTLGLPKPRHYCYPSGEYDAGGAKVMAELGVISATTCVPGLVSTISAPGAFYLPRFLDGESIHPLEFEAEVSGFSEVTRRLLRRPTSNGYRA